ncbi:MAG: carboxypeptidase-like regulatory domain-containing protein [Vicinamibacterales bacterium]
MVWVISMWAVVLPLLQTHARAQTVGAAPPAGVIVGTVVDESGRPAVGVTVQAIVRGKRWNGAYYEMVVGRADETDDRGQFRLHSLAPGSYVVAVGGPVPPGRSPRVSYRRTYNPGTTTLSDAVPVAVVSGREQITSIKLAPTVFFSVSGKVTTDQGTPGVAFDVILRGVPATLGYTGVRGGFMTTVVSTARTEADGTFELLRVPTGSYTMTVSNGNTRQKRPLQIAERSIEVGTAPVSGLTIDTASGATVSGRLKWGDLEPAPWPTDGTLLGRIRATAVGRESDMGSPDTEVNADGTFQFTSLYGLRRIQGVALPFNWAIKSVEAPSNAMVHQNLDVTPGRNITDVTVTVTKRVSTISGTVVSRESAPPGPARAVSPSVLLMPVDPTDLDPMGWGFQPTPAHPDGRVLRYQLERVLPGTYLIVAIDVEPYRLTLDADLMERARAAAKKIALEPGPVRVELEVLQLWPFVREPNVQ